MSERWKDILGYEGLYQVSSQGRVKSLYRRVPHSSNASGFQTVQERIRKNTVSTNGYLVVSLTFKGRIKVFYVHQLVLEAFRGKTPVGKEIRHKDGDSQNCKLSNLRFGTSTQNNEDKRKHGTLAQGEDISSALLTNRQARQMRKMSKTLSRSDLQSHFGVSRGVVYDCLRGKTYKNA